MSIIPDIKFSRLSDIINIAIKQTKGKVILVVSDKKEKDHISKLINQIGVWPMRLRIRTIQVVWQTSNQRNSNDIFIAIDDSYKATSDYIHYLELKDHET